ncbi:MAG: DUF1549 domain-containing protein [Planctomycetes bacterium]|nr:DUF1549 domain-containing protein [Planctomycetota bacterium]
MCSSAVLVAALFVGEPVGEPDAPFADAAAVAHRINAFVEQHWQAAGLHAASPCDDATFLRRVTLDLLGRIPTAHESMTFAADEAQDKRSAAIARLMSSPEYARHWGSVLDEFIQQRHAGDSQFVDYLRDAIAANKPWDGLFREVLLGPWQSEGERRADRFLQQRVRSVDELATDTARVFFGVDISCAKCHDHPLVEDWKQDHYYGMASFFTRTYLFRPPSADKEKRQGGQIAERADGDVKFVDQNGENRTARMMFLSGASLDDPPESQEENWKERREQAKRDGTYLPPPFSRREQLVKTALDERQFFSRAAVNRVWAYLLGRGLVHPVEQMHSQNRPSIPGLLEWLADDWASHGYNLNRLIAAIVLSRPYQLASTQESAGEVPGPEHFAIAGLRPLSPQQYAMSVLLATGEEVPQTLESEAAAEWSRKLEKQARALTAPLDARSDNFQSSMGEALFMSNNAEIQALATPKGQNLAARLAAMADPTKLVETAIWTVHSRAADADEREYLVQWIEERGETRRAEACGGLVWALVTSAEFRFNH